MDTYSVLGHIGRGGCNFAVWCSGYPGNSVNVCIYRVTSMLLHSTALRVSRLLEECLEIGAVTVITQ